LGEIDVRMPKTRDRSGQGIRFTSALLPPYLRKTRRLEEAIPALYLAGVSTNDFDRALQALFGDSVKGLSPSTVARLRDAWEEDYRQWRNTDWSNRRFVYLWVDGIYVNVRPSERQCMLVVMGCDDAGNKHLLALEPGYRESKESWYEVLARLRDHGLEAPKLAIGDGALGFWSAVDEVFPKTRHQRCWVHKTANVLNKLPKSLHKAAKSALHEIYMAPTKADAEEAFDRFEEVYEAKYDKAVECISKDRDVLLSFYDFPAQHWQHIRSTNPIESTFATIRLRTRKTRNCLGETTALTMMHQLGLAAQRRWRKIRGFRKLADVIRGVRFIDGIDEKEAKVSKKAAG
jgi:transposase-like protein